MATRIPIQQKKAGGWWLWLLGLLLAGLVVWALIALFDDDETTAAAPAPDTTAAPTLTPPGTAAPAMTPPTEVGVPVTDLDAIVAAADPAALVGRRVELTDVTVRSVVGDKTFWVGPSDGQQAFVFLLEETSSNSAVEGQVDVNPGQQVSITGVVEKLPPLDQARQMFDLSSTNSGMLKNEQVYVVAKQVQVLSK